MVFKSDFLVRISNPAGIDKCDDELKNTSRVRCNQGR
jgi:hypothetical protein